MTAVAKSGSKSKKTGGLRAAREAMYRSHILAVAEDLFADQGYGQTRMQDVAQAAEISLATLYQQFPGKQVLYRQVLIDRDEEMLAQVSRAAQQLFGQPAGLAELLELLRLQVAYLLEHPAYLRMQLQDGLLWFHSTSRPSEDEERLWQRGLTLIEQMFRWGMDADLFLPGRPLEHARLLLALQQTRLANWVLNEMQDEHAWVIGQVQDDFVRFFCCPQVAKDYFDNKPA